VFSEETRHSTAFSSYQGTGKTQQARTLNYLVITVLSHHTGSALENMAICLFCKYLDCKCAKPEWIV